MKEHTQSLEIIKKQHEMFLAQRLVLIICTLKILQRLKFNNHIK